MSDTSRKAPANAGFTLVEVMISGVLLAVALLAMSGMFVVGYADITSAGRSSNALASARQVLEDVRDLPFPSIVALDGFNTDDPNSLPDDADAREIAKRWRYTLAGDGVAWEYEQGETANYPTNPHDDQTLGSAGRIDVDLQAATLARVRITVFVPGSRRNIELITLVADPS
jgi:type II secretory pathway pseudopilin PulG